MRLCSFSLARKGAGGWRRISTPLPHSQSMLKNTYIEASDSEIHVQIVSKTHGTKWAKFDRHVLEQFFRQFGRKSLSFAGHGYLQFSNEGTMVHMNNWQKQNFPLPGHEDPLNVEVDHIDGSNVWEKKLDNRLSNLRLVSRKENNQNRMNYASIHDVPEPFPGAWAFKPAGIGYVKPRKSNGSYFLYEEYQDGSRVRLWSTRSKGVPDIEKLLETVSLAILHGSDENRAVLKAYSEVILSHM